VRTAYNVVTATIPVGRRPIGIAVTPDSQYLFVATSEDNTVSVIGGSDHSLITTIEVGEWPYGIATTPDGDYVYVTNIADDTVSVIRTSDAIVTATVPVGADPYSLGNFIANVPDGPADDDVDPGHLGSASASPSSGGGGGGGYFITTASCWPSGERHGKVPGTCQDRHHTGKSLDHALIKLFFSHALRFANSSSPHASLYVPAFRVMLLLAGTALTARFAAFVATAKA